MKAVAEAPAKAIITGEHFVVHGAWALAAAIPRKVKVEAEAASAFSVESDGFRPKSRDLSPVARVVDAMAKEFSFSPKVRVSIRSKIPEGAGLGSSASTMVAVAASMSKLNSLGLGVDKIIRFAMVGEQDIHGRPSGIDPTVCALGGAILFRVGSRPKRLSLPGPRRLVIAYSGTKRRTSGQIGLVARVKDRYPAYFSTLARSISGISLSAAEKLEGGDMEGLGSVLAINHAALESLGVSNESLDTLVDLLASMGAYGAKLTGAGGGGSVLAVAPEAKEKRIVSGLSARGFETFSVRIPVEGVRSWLER